jgi:hypothetical protein
MFEYTIICRGDGHTWGFLKQHEFAGELWYHTMFCKGAIIVSKYEGEWPKERMKLIDVHTIRE